MLLGMGQPRPVAIQIAAGGLEDDGLLAEKIGDQPCALMIVDPEDLEHAGIAHEGAGTAAVGGAQLVDILKDGPELDAVARHQTHGAFDRRQMAKGGEFIEQIEDGCGRSGRGPDRGSGHVLQALRDHQTQPAGIGTEAIGRQDEEDGRGTRLEIREGKI